MAVRLDDDIRNSLLDGIDSVFNSGTLEIRSGAQPASANDAATGTVLATIALPADSFAAASGGSKAKAGTWQDASADATGTAGWFRMYNTGDTQRIDGNVTATAGGGDMEIDSVSITAGQTVTVTSFSLDMPAS
jgi:hypothetical protein